MDPIAVEPAKILIVDDKPANLLALEAVLEPLRRPIVSATSGRAALLHLLETTFSVILMDVAMPELDGLETASLIRERERSRQVPIIFVTAQEFELDQVRHAYALGAIDYVVKPFDPLIMRSKVSAFVRLHEQADALQRQATSLTQETGRRIVAEHAAQSKDLAISILGHDLRTPLAVLTTGVELLQSGARDGHDRILLGRMARSVRRMERLVESVLDFARAGVGGGIRITRTVADLDEVTREIVAELRCSHTDRELVVETVGPPTAGFDPARIGQVVSNLVGNALQHSAEGPVTIRVDGADPERVRLVVTNLGVIPGDTIPRLFEPFLRVGGTTHGLGLGLYIVSEIAKAHGGRVDVSVDAGQGTTTFAFELPRVTGGDPVVP